MKKLLLTFCALVFFAGVVAAEPVEQVATVEENVAVEESVVNEENIEVDVEKENPLLAVVAKRGSMGEIVTNIQNMLVKMGYFMMPDGAFGHETEEAVKRFQKSLNVAQDGIVTEDLYRLMKHHSDKIVAVDAPVSYKKQLRMEATAYTTQDPGCGLYTARGNLLRKGLVAVDPNVIPLGTRLYISGYGYAIADDTGGAIKGLRIDLAYESRSEALKFGRRMVTVYILE